MLSGRDGEPFMAFRDPQPPPDRSDPVRVLLVEDDADDYLITREMLDGQAAGSRFSLEWALDYERRSSRFASSDTPSIWSITSSVPTRASSWCRGFASRPFAPVIMLTGHADYETDLAATPWG